ncbi:MAG TPA: isochorismatase family protein, partial [Nordella sp.]|nr:isochorismatase family protein [Nordella sp.]
MRQSLALPDRTALLLIDLQEEQRHDPLYKAFGIEAVLGNAARLLDAARDAQRLVIHAAYRRDYSTHPPRPFEPVGPDGKAVFSDAASPMTEICPEVAPLRSETVIYKNDASAFGEGDLARRLDADEIEWLVIAGVWTEA